MAFSFLKMKATMRAAVNSSYAESRDATKRNATPLHPHNASRPVLKTLSTAIAMAAPHSAWPL